jgi:hypothetical protein
MESSRRNTAEDFASDKFFISLKLKETTERHIETGRKLIQRP